MEKSSIESYKAVEDHLLRSKYIQQVIQNDIERTHYDKVNTIPKVIIQFWDNSSIPSDVLKCINSWSPLEKQGFDRFLFNEKDGEKFILKYFNNQYLEAYNKCNHPAMKCDYFRLCYIFKKGGFYVDADEIYEGHDIHYLFNDNCLKIQPLCYDKSTDQMVSVEHFITEKKDSKDWIFYLNNNPLISPPDHPIIKLALERATEMLLNTRKEKFTDIQSITGPGNLTASIVRHSIYCKANNIAKDYKIIPEWEKISSCCWPLNYRADERNWRLWKG